MGNHTLSDMYDRAGHMSMQVDSMNMKHDEKEKEREMECL